MQALDRRLEFLRRRGNAGHFSHSLQCQSAARPQDLKIHALTEHHEEHAATAD